MKRGVITAVVMSLFLSLAMPIQSFAGHLVEGCSASGTRSVCGSNITTTYADHVSYTMADGKDVICTTTTQRRLHTLYCLGCEGVVGTNVMRICYIQHTICTDELNKCK